MQNKLVKLHQLKRHLTAFVAAFIFVSGSVMTSAATTQTLIPNIPTHPIRLANGGSDILAAPPMPHADISTQVTNTPKPKNIAAQTRLWNLRDVDIHSVIAEVSRETGRNFIIDPRVQGKISIISSTPIGANEVYQVFLAALQVLGYSAVSSNGVTKILPSINAREIGRTLGDGSGKLMVDEVVTQVAKLQHVQSTQLVAALRPLLPDWGVLNAFVPSNSLIIAGPASSVDRLLAIINKVDVPTGDGITIVPLQNATAQDVAAALQSLQSTNSTGQDGLKIAADASSNSVLLSGDRDQRVQMRILISEMDSRSRATPLGSTQVIYLRYLKAVDLAPVLGGIAQSYYKGPVNVVIGTRTEDPQYSATGDMQEGMPASGMPSQTAQPAQTVTASATTSTSTTSTSTTLPGDTKKPAIVIVAEPNTNTIILNAPANVMRILNYTLSRIDVRPTEVRVEALIAEVDDETAHTLGVQWGSITPGTGTGDTDNNVTTGNDNEIGFKQGVGIIKARNGFDIDNFRGIVQALAKDRNSNILSTPSLLVLDNHQAQIVVGKQYSYQDSSYPGNSQGAGPQNPFNTFKRANAALHLFVTPQVNRDGTVDLSIDQGNDTLQNPDEPGTLPIVNTSNIRTSVLVNNGDILVLGGLIQNTLSRGHERIPFLGDIPVVGVLFGTHSHAKEKKNLMVFIQPIVIHNRDVGLSVTEDKYKYVREKQVQWMKEEHYQPDLREFVMPKWPYDQPLPHPFTGSTQH